jgi:hypothetical protein
VFNSVNQKINPLNKCIIITGAKRFVDGINDESYKTGIFYASKPGRVIGPVIDQGTIFPDLNNEGFQDNAVEAIHRAIN